MKRSKRPVPLGRNGLPPLPPKDDMPLPLHPSTVTAASRIMLPTYCVLFALIGLAFLFQKPRRTLSHHYDVPKMLMGGAIEPWGFFFLLISALMVVGLVLHDRRFMQWVLVAASSLVGFWGILFLSAGFRFEDVSFTAGVFVLGWVPCLVASIASLGRNET